MLLLPDTLARELRVEHGIIDRSEVALGADLGVKRAAFRYARWIDLPRRIVGENLRGPFRWLQPAEALWILAKGIIGTTQHIFDANEILKRDRRAEQRLPGGVGRKIDQGRSLERLADVADQGLLDRGVVLRP